MDKTLTPLEEIIRSGLGRRFQQVFNVPLLFSNTSDKKARYAKQLAENPNQKLPFAFSTFTGQSLSETRYSPQALLRGGLYGNASHDNVQTYRLRLLPVTTTYQITYLASDLDGVAQFSKRWLMSSIEGSLKFTVTYGIYDIPIHIDLDRDVSIPQRTQGIDEPVEYEVVVNLRIEGYLSKDLELAQAATDVVTEGRTGSAEAVKEALAGDPRGTTQFFEIRKSWDNT